MKGFIGFLNKSEKKLKFNQEKEFENDTKSESISTNNFFCRRFTINKYLADKVFEEDNDLFICLEGVVLNKDLLTSKYSENDFFKLIKKLFISDRKGFCRNLSGEFSIVVYDKKEDKLHIYTNQINSKPVYYYSYNGILFFSTSIGYLTKILKENGIKVNLDGNGVSMLLSYGFMLLDSTLVEGLTKLPPSSCFEYNNSVSINAYENIFTYDVTCDKKSIFDNLTELYNQAIELEFNKDKEYGAKHLVTISGGLDSRLSLLSSLELGYENSQCISFSESNYLDEVIAKKICSDKNIPLLFDYLDGGGYLTSIDDIVRINGGQVTYNGAAHLRKMLKNMDLRDYGLLHTGQLGDAVFGSYVTGCKDISFENLKIGYSTKLKSRIDKSIYDDIKNRYNTLEEFKFFNRGVNGILNGNFMASESIDAVSPFLEKDFLKYVLSIDDSLRKNEDIYIRWLNKYNKDLIKYKWERINSKPTVFNNYFSNQLLFMKNVRRYIYKKFNKVWYMNDYKMWYNQNEALRSSLSQSYKDRIGLLEDIELQKVVSDLFLHGNIREKFQVLTLLSFVKQFIV